MYVTAYLFKQQQLLVNPHFQLPSVPQQQQDLIVSVTSDVIARDVQDHDVSHMVAQGYQWLDLRQLVQIWHVEQFKQASRALQLLEWQRNYKFCSRCAHPVQLLLTQYVMCCSACGYRYYPRVNPCVITLITRGQDEILLAKNARTKTQMYSLIAGFVEVGENVEEAVHRETFEEVGLQIKNLQYFASQSWPFPSNLMLAFRAEYAAGDIQLQAKELSDAQFFKLDQLPELPFSGSIAHRMIMDWIQRMKNQCNQFK